MRLPSVGLALFMFGTGVLLLLNVRALARLGLAGIAVRLTWFGIRFVLLLLIGTLTLSE